MKSSDAEAVPPVGEDQDRTGPRALAEYGFDPWWTETAAHGLAAPDRFSVAWRLTHRYDRPHKGTFRKQAGRLDRPLGSATVSGEIHEHGAHAEGDEGFEHVGQLSLECGPHPELCRPRVCGDADLFADAEIPVLSEVHDPQDTEGPDEAGREGCVGERLPFVRLLKGEVEVIAPVAVAKVCAVRDRQRGAVAGWLTPGWQSIQAAGADR